MTHRFFSTLRSFRRFECEYGKGAIFKAAAYEKKHKKVVLLVLPVYDAWSPAVIPAVAGSQREQQGAGRARVAEGGMAVRGGMALRRSR